MLDRRWKGHRLLETHPWVVMALIISSSLLLALGMVRLDQGLDLTPDQNQVWLYGGTAEAAISLLSAVASSAITVAGVVFSATFVTMQLASSQYTPRVVQALSRRWTLQIVLGFFLGNFVYSLIVLRSVRPANAASGADEFVPVVAVSVGVILSILCVGVLAFYIVYGMRSLQPTFLIDSAARETVGMLERRLAAGQQRSIADPHLPEMDPSDAWICRYEDSGYLQRVRILELLDIATEAGLVVRIDGMMGQFCLQGEPMLTVTPTGNCTPAVQKRLRRCVILGLERTPEQDIEFGFRRVADIMLKAISAAINDPTTAEYCLNRLGELTVLMASQPEAHHFLADAEDTIRVIWRAEPFARCVRTAFSQLRFYLDTDAHLMHATLDILGRTSNQVAPAPREVIRAEAARLRTAFLAHLTDPADREMVAAGGAWIDELRPAVAS